MRLIKRLKSWLAKNLQTNDERGWVIIGDNSTPTQLTTAQLLSDYNDTAYYCANMNARSVARQTLRLYVRTAKGQPDPKCPTRPTTKRLATPESIAEVTTHPLIDFLDRPTSDRAGNTLLNRYELLETTQLQLELAGKSYWRIDSDRMGRPKNIQLLNPALITVKTDDDDVPVQYVYRRGLDEITYPPQRIVAIRCAHPQNIYSGGTGPSEAAATRRQVNNAYLDQTAAFLKNRSRPDAIVSPSHHDGVIGEPEARRLESAMTASYAATRAGRIFVARDSLQITPLTWSPRDIGEITDAKFQVEQIARAFDIPLALLNKDANRASAKTSREQYAEDAIIPRLRRIENAINERIVPRYDQSRRLFVAFDDPTPIDPEINAAVRQINLQTKYTTINEERRENGLPPVDWGQQPQTNEKDNDENND